MVFDGSLAYAERRCNSLAGMAGYHHSQDLALPGSKSRNSTIRFQPLSDSLSLARPSQMARTSKKLSLQTVETDVAFRGAFRKS